MNQPVNIFASHTLENNSISRDILVDISSETFNFPPQWDVDLGTVAVDIFNYEIPAGESFSFETHLLLGELDHTDVGVGFQVVNITVRDEHNNAEIYSGIDTLEYEVFVKPMPSPTFRFSDYSLDSLDSDTVYVSFDIFEEWSFEFFATAEFHVEDLWQIDRRLIFEPLEIISENIASMECENHDPYLLDPDKSWCKGDTVGLTSSFIHGQEFYGFLESGDDFTFEALINIYDPLDSLRSNHQVRFIGNSRECVDGTYTQIVDPATTDSIQCNSSSVILNALPEFVSVEWNDSNGNTYSGTSIELQNIDPFTYIQVRAYDENGCLFLDDYYLSIEQEFAPLVDNVNDSEQITTCLGAQLELSVKPEYTNVVWVNQATVESTNGNDISFVVDSNFIPFRITAENEEGCTVYMDFYVYTEITEAEIVEGSSGGNVDIEVCAGADLILAANSDYTNVTWFNGNNQDSIPGQSISLTDLQEFTYYYVTAEGPDGCEVFQYVNIEVNTDFLWDENLLARDSVISALCRIVELEVNPGYTDVEWYYNEPSLPNEILFASGPTAILDATDLLEFEYLDLRVTATSEEGCLVETYYPLDFLGPEEKNLIDASANGSFCEGDEIVLSALDTYIKYIWTYQGQEYNSESININASDDPITLVAFDELGCSYIDTYEVNLTNIPAGNICLVTNDVQSGNNVILWESPEDSTNISSFSVYREGSSTNDFELLGEVPANEPHEFIDETADPTQQAYKYVVTSNNECENESDYSNFHKTIHLTINLGTNDNVNLIWDSYVGIDYEQVKIYRGSSFATLEEYVSLPSTVLSFTDQNPPSGDVYYQIEIPNQVDCKTGKRIVSIRSNVAFFELDAVENISEIGALYPNPFDDNLTIEIEREGLMDIYNPMGQLVYSEMIKSGHSQINTSDFLAGSYFIKITSANNYYYANFIKI